MSFKTLRAFKLSLSQWDEEENLSQKTQGVIATYLSKLSNFHFHNIIKEILLEKTQGAIIACRSKLLKNVKLSLSPWFGTENMSQKTHGVIAICLSKVSTIHSHNGVERKSHTRHKV